MDEKILRETFDHNLNESFRLKQLENGLSVFTVIKTTQTNLVTKSMEKPLFRSVDSSANSGRVWAFDDLIY